MEVEPLFIFYPYFAYKMFQIFAPLTISLPTSADAQTFKRWREQLHDSTLIYSRPLFLPKKPHKERTYYCVNEGE